MTERSFDASHYLTRVNGKEYLEVKWRLLWLRTEHPDAIVNTELVREQDGLAIFKARINLPGGGEATGWGSETMNDFPDYIEKAETKSLGRALAALGYGTQFCEEFEQRLVDAPVEKPRAPARTTPATSAQVTAIYAIARKDHGLNEESVDQRARESFGRPTRELTKREASLFIDQLRGSR